MSALSSAPHSVQPSPECAHRSTSEGVPTVWECKVAEEPGELFTDKEVISNVPSVPRGTSAIGWLGGGGGVWLIGFGGLFDWRGVA
jgi:hypothetical protein